MFYDKYLLCETFGVWLFKDMERWLSGKESAFQNRRRGLDPWVGKIPWRRKWQSTIVFFFFFFIYVHSSVLAWRIPWAEEPSGLPSMGSQRVGHDWVTGHRNRHVSSKTLIFFSDLGTQWSGLNYPTLQEGFLQNFPVHTLVQCWKLIMPIKISLFIDCNGPSSLGS